MSAKICQIILRFQRKKKCLRIPQIIKIEIAGTYINILKENLDDDVWNNQLPIAIRSLFEECKVLGGTISGEHGIGYVQKQYMDVMMTPIHFSLMQRIKKVFDPNGIMNPGKLFDIATHHDNSNQ